MIDRSFYQISLNLGAIFYFCKENKLNFFNCENVTNLNLDKFLNDDDLKWYVSNLKLDAHDRDDDEKRVEVYLDVFFRCIENQGDNTEQYFKWNRVL